MGITYKEQQKHSLTLDVWNHGQGDNYKDYDSETAMEEKQMTYNPQNAKEIRGLPQDVIFDGVIIELQDGHVAEFVKDTTNWKGDPNEPAIEIVIEVLHNNTPYHFKQLFTYHHENGSTAFKSRSNLGKYNAKYGKLPEIKDKVKAYANTEGFLKLKLE